MILLDVMMPGLDGWRVAEQLLDDESTQDIPIIFLTARAEFRDRARGLDIGGVDYVTKPFNPLELAPLVHDLLDRIDRGERDDCAGEALGAPRADGVRIAQKSSATSPIARAGLRRGRPGPRPPASAKRLSEPGVGDHRRHHRLEHRHDPCAGRGQVPQRPDDEAEGNDRPEHDHPHHQHPDRQVNAREMPLEGDVAPGDRAGKLHHGWASDQKRAANKNP